LKGLAREPGGERGESRRKKMQKTPKSRRRNLLRPPLRLKKEYSHFHTTANPSNHSPTSVLSSHKNKTGRADVREEAKRKYTNNSTPTLKEKRGVPKCDSYLIFPKIRRE